MKIPAERGRSVLRAYKTELDLNNVQKTRCAQHAGAARYAFNWGLARKIAAFEANEKTPTAIDLHKELNGLKKNELAWLYESSKCAPQEALRNLDKAFDNFFRRVQLKKQGQLKGKIGFPKFKSKKGGLGSFRLTGTIRVFEKHIQLPRLGKLKLKERGYLPVRGVKILSATMREQAGRWFVSLQVETDSPKPAASDQPVAGVDLGLKALATVSDGTVFANPQALKRDLQKVKRLQRAVSRKVRGSANQRKAVQHLARAHLRVANIRRNALHQATTTLAKTKSVIVLEDLNVSGMLKNHKLARAISDVGFGEFRRQLEYKTQWYGGQVLVADRFFPSSKMCSGCRNVKAELALSERVFKCEVCGFACGRDLNAALNLARLAGSSPDTLNACRENIGPDASSAVLHEAGTELQSVSSRFA
jgi:putative transposase